MGTKRCCEGCNKRSVCVEMMEEGIACPIGRDKMSLAQIQLMDAGKCPTCGKSNKHDCPTCGKSNEHDDGTLAQDIEEVSQKTGCTYNVGHQNGCAYAQYIADRLYEKGWRKQDTIRGDNCEKQK